MTSGITTDNIVALVTESPDEFVALINNASGLLLSLMTVRKLCKSKDISFPVKATKKKSVKKITKKKALTAYNFFLKLCKNDDSLKGLPFGEKSAEISKLWKTETSSKSERWKKCIQLSNSDKVQKVNDDKEAASDDSKQKADEVNDKEAASDDSKQKADEVNDKEAASDDSKQKADSKQKVGVKKVSKKAGVKKVSKKAGVKKVSKKAVVDEVNDKEAAAVDDSKKTAEGVDEKVKKDEAKALNESREKSINDILDTLDEESDDESDCY
jgi:hypothetical protein